MPLAGDAAILSVGLICPLGGCLPDAAAALRSGDKGIAPLERFSGPSNAAWYAAPAPEVDPGQYLEKPKDAKLIGRSTALALAAVAEALQGVADEGAPPHERIGVFCGAGQAGLEADEFFRAIDASRKPPNEDLSILGGRPSRAIDPFFSLRTLSNASVHYVAQLADAAGPSQNFVQGPAAGIQAIGAACDAISGDQCDRAIAVAHDALILPSMFEVFAANGLLREGSDGHGIVPGEAAAAFVIARARDGAKATLVPYAVHSGLPSPDYAAQTGYLGAAQALVELALWLESEPESPAAMIQARPLTGTAAAIHVRR